MKPQNALKKWSLHRQVAILLAEGVWAAGWVIFLAVPLVIFVATFVRYFGVER